MSDGLEARSVEPARAPVNNNSLAIAVAVAVALLPGVDALHQLEVLLGRREGGVDCAAVVDDAVVRAHPAGDLRTAD